MRKLLIAGMLIVASHQANANAPTSETKTCCKVKYENIEELLSKGHITVREAQILWLDHKKSASTPSGRSDAKK